MQMEWKLVKHDNGTEALFGGFKTSDLEESTVKANQAIKIIKSHRKDKHTHMGLSSEGLDIMLYGVSKNKIEDSDWVIANEIKKALSS